jgi:hypothetical protein
MATTTGSIDQRETTSLIGSDKVEGTAVYGPDREKIGSIERVIDRQNERQSSLRCSELWRVLGYG